MRANTFGQGHDNSDEGYGRECYIYAQSCWEHSNAQGHSGYGREGYIYSSYRPRHVQIQDQFGGPSRAIGTHAVQSYLVSDGIKQMGWICVIMM